MALQNPKQPSKLFIPPASFNATISAGQTPLRTTVQHKIPPPTLHIQQPSVHAPFINPLALQPHQMSPFRGRHRQGASIAQFSLNSPSAFLPAQFQPNLTTYPSSPTTGNLRSRRTASISLGGPPKALLGGPQRKLSPLSGLDTLNPSPVAEQQLLRKKIIVNLPEEVAPTIYEGKSYQTPPWARKPCPHASLPPSNYVQCFSDIQTREASPEEIYSRFVPAPYEISLPRQESWIIWRKTVLDEKLAQLGVNRNQHLPYPDPDEQQELLPELISSPADPSLLSFKLHKLQQVQDSIESPHEDRVFDLHSVSLLDMPTKLSPSISVNPELVSELPLHAPQAWAPVSQSSHLLCESRGTDTSISRPLSARDFARGFGINVFGEEATPSFNHLTGSEDYDHLILPQDLSESPRLQHSHIRSMSKLSHSMEQIPSFAQVERFRTRGRHSFDLGQQIPSAPPYSQDAVTESADRSSNHSGENNESEDEYSNPSDEERARLKRLHLRMARLSRGTEELPRHSQRFLSGSGEPHAQETQSQPPDDEIMSNPSDEAISKPETGQFTRISRPLPPIPHSRTSSNTAALVQSIPHSGIGGQPPMAVGKHAGLSKEQLNPLAKPFTFGRLGDALSHSPDPPAALTGRPSLNAFAQEFKPSNFSFQPPPGIPQISFPSHSIQQRIPSLGREEQGREKRVRRESTKSIESLPNYSSISMVPDPNKVTPHAFGQRHETGSQDYSSLGSQDANDAMVLGIQGLDVDDCISERLEFQHHISQNRVPASLFKAFGPVGSHSKRQSLEDNQVQSISRTAAGAPVIAALTDEHYTHSNSPSIEEVNDVNSTRGPATSLSTDTELTSNRLERILQEKLVHHREDIVEFINKIATTGSTSRLGNSSSGSEFVKPENTERHSHHVDHDLQESRNQTEVSNLLQILQAFQTQLPEQLHKFLEIGDDNRGLRSIIEDTVNRVLVPITLSTTEIATRMDGLEMAIKTRHSEDQEILVHDVLAVLTPRLDDLRPEPIDLDLLTARLSTAVRPEIHELIDLTSDKKETASLIVQQLKPLLQGIAGSQHELLLNSMLTYLSAELRQLLSAFDGHKLKEDISDLVFERLDCRLRLQEQKAREGSLPAPLLDRLDDVLQPLLQSLEVSKDMTSDIGTALMDIPSIMTSASQDTMKALSGQTDSIQTKIVESSDQLFERLDTAITPQLTQVIKSLSHFSSVSSTIDQDQMRDQLNAIYSLGKEAAAANLPVLINSLSLTVDLLQKRMESLQQSQVAVTPLMNKIQTLDDQVAELHGRLEIAHREKLEVADRAKSSEAECNVLGRRVRDLEIEISAKADEFTDCQAQAKRMQEALLQSESRLTSTSTSLEKSWARVCELEAVNRELSVEKTQLKAKVDMLEMQAGWSMQTAEARQKEIQLLRDDRDRLLAHGIQKSDWQQTTDQLEALSQSVKTRDTKDREDYHCLRDRHKVLEGEHNALQKRFREQESKLTNVERASATLRQNLTQSQQRTSDWEKRNGDLENLLEHSKEQLEQSEESKHAAESELASVLAANETTQADHQAKINVLQKEIAFLKTELVNLKGKAPVQEWRNRKDNLGSRSPTITTPSNSSIISPNSRASTPTPIQQRSSIQTPPENDSGLPATSTWDSMHAPKSGRPFISRHSGGRPSNTSYRPSSPTASVVSNAPTLQEDGWWA